MAVKTHIVVDGGQATTGQIGVSDESVREDTINERLDARIDFLANQIATMPVTLTAAYIRQALRFLMVTMLWILRAMRRRFDAVED